LVQPSIEYHRGMERAARVLAISSGVLLLLLAVPWTVATLFIGSTNVFFLVLLGLYAIGLALVGVRLVLPGHVGRAIWVGAVVLPLAPLLATVLLARMLPPPDATGAPDSGPWIWLLPLAASCCSLAAFALTRKGSSALSHQLD
jgi:hypothetical protein